MYKSISDYVYFLSPEFRKSLELNSAFQIKKGAITNYVHCWEVNAQAARIKYIHKNWVNSSYLNSFIRNLCTPLGSTCCCLLSAEAERLLSTDIRLRDRGEKQEEDGSSYKK